MLTDNMESLKDAMLKIIETKVTFDSFMMRKDASNTDAFQKVRAALESLANFLADYESKVDVLLAQSSGQQRVNLLGAKANLHNAWFFTVVDFSKKRDSESLSKAVLHLDLAENYLKDAGFMPETLKKAA